MVAVDADFAPGRKAIAERFQDLVPNKQTWTPSWGGVTLGTAPVNTGQWWQVGLAVFFTARLTLGTGGDVTGTITLSWSGVLPNMDPDLVETLVVPAYASHNLGNPRHSGVGIPLGQTGIDRIVSSGTNVGWSATQPFDWAAGYQLRLSGSYLTTP